MPSTMKATWAILSFFRGPTFKLGEFCFHRWWEKNLGSSFLCGARKTMDPGNCVCVTTWYKCACEKLKNLLKSKRVDMMTRLDQPHLPQCMCEDRQAGFPHLHGSQLGWREIGYQITSCVFFPTCIFERCKSANLALLCLEKHVWMMFGQVQPHLKERESRPKLASYCEVHCTRKPKSPL